MRKLTKDEIEKFSNISGARKIAVENFLLTVHNQQSIDCAFKNLNFDAMHTCQRS